MGNPTLKDVAEHAGVSLATASRALSGDHPMAEVTRERVLASVEELGYRRPRGSRPTAPLVAVVASTISHHAVASVVAGVEDTSAGVGRLCTISVSHADADRELALLDAHADDDRIGAVVVVGGLHVTPTWQRAVTGLAQRFHSRGVPLVFAGRGIDDINLPGLTVVDYDTAGGAAAAVGGLVGRGHRAVGLVRGPRGYSTSEARQAGCRQAFAEHGLELTDDQVVEGQLLTSTGEGAVATLLRRRPDLTAILAENDTVATGVIRGARLLGLAVPDDLSVMGFDDMRGVDALVPALTTVHTPFAELGRRAARLALGAELGPPPREVLIGTHVVVRESVAAPRRRRLAPAKLS